MCVIISINLFQTNLDLILYYTFCFSVLLSPSIVFNINILVLLNIFVHKYLYVYNYIIASSMPSLLLHVATHKTYILSL